MSKETRPERIEMIENMTTEALDLVLAVLITVANGDKEVALRGVECVCQDMIRNVEAYYAKTGAET